MERGESVDERAAAVFASVRRSERVWPAALIVCGLYLAGSFWGFSRELGSTGITATVRATPSLWIPAMLAAIVVGARVLSRIAEESGASPFWWPRQARRVLVVLAFLLPVLVFAVEPLLVILAIDAGDPDPATLGGWLLHITVSVAG